MKIVHIAPNAPYNDYWGYQDNLLPKYHKKLGHEVSVIITTQTHKDGKIVSTESTTYQLNDGTKIFRKNYKNFYHRTLTNILSYIPVYDLLLKLKPDFIFYHGLLSATIFDVIHYKKEHPGCCIVQDNHLDYNIGNQADTFKQKLLRKWYRFVNKKSIPYVDKVYGVTPWRKTYAEDYFGIPREKTDVLIMGADDEKINFDKREEIREEVRKKYHIGEKDFLIVSGGKIDKNKNIDLLAEACANIGNNIKLLIFGSISDELKEKMHNLFKEPNIIYLGWINADQVYNYFFAADLVFFPGQHSVLWEQACASKVPCVFEKWEGMNHVNNGGNSDFIDNPTTQTIRQKIKQLYFTDKYNQMKKAAQSSKTDIYLYSNIAKKSLECIKHAEQN